ncbi:MAG: HAD family hydrolase [Cyanobacteriota bacterium]|nr:HAD family hydrolase [Cyanobacteriota bacterium]
MVKISCGEAVFTEIEAVLFDKDGTLEDSHQFLRELAQRRSRLIDAQIPGVGEPLLMAFGVGDRATFDPTGLMAVGSRTENIIAAAAYIAETGRSWVESLEIARNAFTEADRTLHRTPENSPMVAGTLAILQRFSAMELKLGILSAATPEGVAEFVEHHQLQPYFQLKMGVTSQGPFKPSPYLFYKACGALGVNPGKTLMIGDSALDMQMAHQAEAAGAIAFCPQGGSLDGADVAIADFEELKVI